MSDQRSYGIMAPGASRLKRKERESFHPAPAKRSSIAPPPGPPPLPPPRTTVVNPSMMTKTSTGSKGMEDRSCNKLLAGYLAYEFLTKGTLLGKKFEGARAEMKTLKGNESYEEIASLMMNPEGGVHIPGIVNPTHLARWIEM